MELEGDIVQRRLIFNPKNRFLCIFCHATDVGGSWGVIAHFNQELFFFYNYFSSFFMGYS